MTQKKIKVLYIAGWGRSGSTILARILGQIEGFFHGGELRTIWKDGFKPNGICGCGEKVFSCPVWTSIFAKLGDIDQVNRQGMINLREKNEPKTQEVLASYFFPQKKTELSHRLVEYIDYLDQFYQTISSGSLQSD